MKEYDTIRRIEKIIDWVNDPREALKRINYALKRYVKETGECLDFILDPTPGTDAEAEEREAKNNDRTT